MQKIKDKNKLKLKSFNENTDKQLIFQKFVQNYNNFKNMDN